MLSLLPLYVSFGLMGGVFGVSRPPTLLEQPPKEAAYVLMEAQKLPCIADADPPPKYSWFKNGKFFNPAANSGRYAIWPGQGTLIFANPHEDDDGLYQCIAENQYGKSLSVKTNLRRAEFSSFDGPAKTVSVNRGSSLTLKCGKPTSYPPPKVFWRFTNQSSINNVIEDSRHSTNIYGDLVFASVQKDDNNVQYFCVISSELLAREERGYPYTIKVRNMDSNPDHGLTMISKSPAQRTGLMNQSIDFICIFGGNPIPSINWRFLRNNVRHDVSTLPHVRIDRSGVRLIIDKITQDHQGTFQCVGSNPVSTDDTYQFKLIVKSTPYWEKKPENTMQPPGGSHVFECVTHGDPKPTISWTVNGDQASKWITAAPTRRRLLGTKLVINSLTPDDTAVIQCNASNSFGYVFADAYINVVQEPPSFIKKMPGLTYKAEAQSVILDCATYSAPAAIPTWIRVERNQQLTGGRYNVLANSNLEIKRLMVSDTGDYQCTATNLYGSVTTAGRLVVRRRTEITLAPHDVRVYERTDVKFVCAGSTDPLEVKSLRQMWMKDGVLIDLTKQARVRVNPADNSLIIGGVRPMDTGSYTCIITNGIDQANASASLIVQGRPDQPNSVTVDCTTKKAERKAIVNWKAGADNSAPILKYEIEFAVDSQPFSWFPADIVKSEAVSGEASSGIEQGGANPSAEVIMRPGLKYSFRVRARNIVGLSEPSVPGRTSCSNDPAPPDTNPTNLWAEGTLPNNIIVHWTPMSELEKNAGGLEYQLKIFCVDCTNMPSDRVNTTYITNWRDTSLAFINAIRVNEESFQIERYKKFNVTMLSRNLLGSSSMAETKGSGYSGEGPPSVTVTDVVVKPGSSQNVGQDNKLTLEWTVPADVNSTDAVNGFFRGYRIEWCQAGLNEEQCEATKRFEDFILNQPQHPLHMKYRRRRRRSAEEEVSRTKRATPTRVSYTVTRLPGATRLRMWLRVLNKRNAGPPSNIVELTTAEGTPGPVSEFTRRTKGVTHLAFSWEVPVQTNGNLTGYQMGVQMISGLDLGYLKRYPEITDASALSGEVAGLKPDSMYRVYIWPRTKAGYGVSTFVDVKTSPANVAPGSPTIRIDSVTTSSINVSFAPSETGEPGSVFYVQFRLPGRNKWEESQREFSKRWLLLSDLPTDTSYQVRVVATNGEGLTSFSETVWVTTSGPGPNKLVGASATWFIAVICLLIVLICGIVGLFYLRKKRFETIRGKPIPQEDPDKPRYMAGGRAPSIPASQPADEPTKQESLAPSDDPYTMGRIGHDHYQNVPFPDDQGSMAPSLQGGAPPPLYKDLRPRDSPPQEDEWQPPMPGRSRVIRAPSDDFSNIGAPPVASPVPSSTGASVNPNPTFI